jgi:prophage regulatory protein
MSIAGTERSHCEVRFLRRREVERVTGLTRATIYRQIAAGAFPKPIKIGKKASGWLEAEIADWQKRRIAERDRGPSR